jgi:hypothetical protein
MNRATIFLLGSLMLLFTCSVAKGQGSCGSVLVPHFSVYNSVSGDGTNIYTHVTIQGYASFSAPCVGMNSAVHHNHASNTLNNATHSTDSSNGCPTCWFQVTDDDQIVGVPGVVYPWSWDGVAICSIAGTFFNSGGGGGVASYTPVQHTYPGNPLSQPCWISRFFDRVLNGKKHQAQDVDFSNSNSNGGLVTPYGTPVYAAEAGTVVAEASTNGPAPGGYPSCVGTNAAANYVKIKSDSDSYTTSYVHVTLTVANNVHVSQGQQIGVTDDSGCQSGGHVHVARRDTSGTPVNFKLPCVNPVPTNNFDDGLVYDDVPDNI